MTGKGLGSAYKQIQVLTFSKCRDVQERCERIPKNLMTLGQSTRRRHSIFFVRSNASKRILPNDATMPDASGSFGSDEASMVRPFSITSSIFLLCRYCGSQREVLRGTSSSDRILHRHLHTTPVWIPLALVLRMPNEASKPSMEPK